jgi:hypothetical protein
MKSKLFFTLLTCLIVFFLVGSIGDDRLPSDLRDYDYAKTNYDSSNPDDPSKYPPITPIVATQADELINELAPSRISATTYNPLYWIACGGKKWINYDFRSKSISTTNVDWPIMIIFYGNATVNKVKNIYGGITIASTMYAAYDIGIGTQWDSDRGTKMTVTFGGPDGSDNDTLHLRLYAPSTDYFDGDGGWGHYVIASTHFDFNPPWDTICGYSEDAEHMAVQIAANQGYTVYYDYTYIYNYESFRNENNHYWQSDGYASLVYVP